MIKCTLIEIDNDNRAVIYVGEDPLGSVKRTAPVYLINYKAGLFYAGEHEYEFNTADEAVR